MTYGEIVIALTNIYNKFKSDDIEKVILQKVSLISHIEAAHAFSLLKGELSDPKATDIIKSYIVSEGMERYKR